MADPVDLLFDNLVGVKTGTAETKERDIQRQNMRKPVLEKIENDTTGGAIPRALANIAMNTANAVDAVTPGDIFTQHEKTLEKQK